MRSTTSRDKSLKCGINRNLNRVRKLNRQVIKEAARSELARSEKARKRNGRMKNEELLNMWAPSAFNIFHCLMFRPSTIKNKISHCVLFISYLFANRLISRDHEYECVNVEEELPKIPILKLLFGLRDWILAFVSAGYCRQTIRNYAESAYTVLAYTVPRVTDFSYVWRHIWKNTRRQAAQGDPSHAPPVTRSTFRQLSEHSQILGLLLISTSWRFHSIRSVVQISKRSKSELTGTHYWVAVIDSVKYLPIQTGLCKRIYCNCNKQRGNEFCFIHRYIDASNHGIISNLNPLVCSSPIKALQREMKIFGIREHSWHVTSAMSCAFYRSNFPGNNIMINRWNNWNGRNDTIFKRYTRHVNEFSMNSIIPMDVALLAFYIDEAFLIE